MSSKVRLRQRQAPQAFLVLCPAVLLFYSFTSSAAQKQVAGSAGEGLTAAGAGPTTGDGAVEARRGGRAGAARPTAVPTLASESAASRRETDAKENTVPVSSSLHATLWNLAVKWPKGDNRVAGVGRIAAANEGLSKPVDVYDKVEGTIQDFEAGRQAAKRRRVTTLLVGSPPAEVQSTEGTRSPTRRGVTGVRGATLLPFKRASPARTAATAGGALVKMPGQVGTTGAAQRNLQDTGRGASGSCDAVADERAKAVAAKAAATAGLVPLRVPPSVGNPRQVADTGAARAGDDSGPAREQSAQIVAKNLKGATAPEAEPSKMVALATQEYHPGENDKAKLGVDAQQCTPSQSQPGVGGKHYAVTGLQQNGHTEVDIEGMQKQHHYIEDALRQREDIVQQTVSPLHSAEGTSSGARTCRDWRRLGPHPWLLESPFFVESVTVPTGIELVSQLLPLLFYGIDEEGDVVMYLQLSDINVGVARTQLSNEQITSVFRFRFFVVFGWLAPGPYARAKVFIDARKFKVTDALLHGGISLATPFITSFASTVGQTPLTATPSTHSSYSAYPYSDSRATSLSSRSSSGYDMVTTQMDGVSRRSNSRAAAGHDSVAGCHSKDNSSSRSPSRTVNMSTGRDIDSSRSICEGVDRLREVHVLEAPLGSAVFFRLAQAIVGVQIPIHFYSSPAEVLRSTFAVTTGIEKALLPGVRRVFHAWTQRARVSSKQQNKNTHTLRKSSSHRDGEPHRPRNSSRHRRNPAYNGEESSSPSGAAEAQNESSFRSHEAFALEKCFVEFLAYLKSNALSNSSQAYYRRQTNQGDSNCRRWRVSREGTAAEVMRSH